MLKAGLPCPELVAITDLDQIDHSALIAALSTWRKDAVRTTIAVQLRQPAWSSKRVHDAAARLLEALEPLHIDLIINDRLDVALALGVQAIHLRAKSVDVSDVRSLLPNAWISIAAHTLSDVARASANGVDAIVYSPIFEVPRKGAPVGLDGLRHAVVAAEKTPVIALGGIDRSRANACFECGASAVAMIRGVLGPIPITIRR